MSTLALTGWPTETHGTRGTARTVRSICKGIGPGGQSSVGEATVDEAVQQEAMDEVEPEELAASMADGRLRHGKQELVSTSQASRRSAAAHMATAAEEERTALGRAERPRKGKRYRIEVKPTHHWLLASSKARPLGF